MNLLRPALSALLIALPVFCNAKLPELSLGVTAGLAKPTGNFAKADYSDPASGFAKQGLTAGLIANARISKHWGVTALATYTGYGYTGGIQLAEGYKEAFGVDSSSFILKGSNHTLNIMAGPVYTTGLSKLHVDVRLLVGLVQASLAGNEITMEDNPDATFYQKQAYASAFGLQGGAAFRYNLTRKIDVAAGVDYAWSKPGFTIENVNRNNAAGRLLTSYNEPLTSVTTHISVMYRFR